MYLIIKDSDNIKDHYKITDLISRNNDHKEKENFWYKFDLEQYWTGYCWSSGMIDNIKDIDEYLTKKFKELQEKSWNEIIENYFNYVEKYFNYVEKYGWPKIIHQFTLKILFLIKNLLKVTLFSVKIL